MLARGNAFTGEISTCVAQSNRYDFVSGMTFATGNVLCSYPAHSDIPQEGSFDASGLIFAALGMVAAFAVVGALSLTGIGALAVGGLVFGAVTGALNASKAAYDAGITGVEYWKTVGLGALTGGVKGLLAGLAIGLAPYAAEAFIASYFPIGLMVGGTYMSSAALTTMSAYGLGAISSIFATLQVNEIVSPVGSNYFRELTGMNEETYNSLSSVISAAASAIIMMGTLNPRAWSDVKNNQNTMKNVLHQGWRDLTGRLPSKTNNTYVEINIHGKINSELDEVDLIEGIIYEDKNASKLYIQNPDFPQTEQQWANKQIFNKTVNRINSLQQSEFTLSSTVSTVLPTTDSLRGIRTFVFRIDADTPELRSAVSEAIYRLSKMYPDYIFKAVFGGK